MIKYTVEVDAEGRKKWYRDNMLHCEHEPAVVWADGDKWYYLHGIRLTKAEWEERMNKSCSGKIVEIDGVKYKLEEV